MGARETLDQINGILTRMQMPFETRDDGWGYSVGVGSASVWITADAWGDATAVHLSGAMLEELELDDDDARARAHGAANRLNCSNYFARFCVYENTRTLSVEHDLLGEDLQASELVGALTAVGRAADRM